jgi:hypothetical protein
MTQQGSERGRPPAVTTGCGVIKDLPTGWRGVLHDLGMSLGIAQPTPGERAHELRQAQRAGIQRQSDREAGE